jgi:hypothetical protein
MSLSSLSVLVILVFSEGKTEDTIFWGKTRWFLREKQGDTRETRFLREKGALSEGKPAHTPFRYRPHRTEFYTLSDHQAGLGR